MPTLALKQFSQVISFWFEEIEPSMWFKKDANFDQLIREQFLETYYAATRGELFEWRVSPQGCLAEIILLDQFSRNMFRDSAQAFQFDSLALVLAQQAVSLGFDHQLALTHRKFLYMPYMHSESLIIHQQAVKLFAQPGLEDNYRYELQHQEIIQQFGRYPHRNAILGRESSEQELVFLTQPGSAF